MMSRRRHQRCTLRYGVGPPDWSPLLFPGWLRWLRFPKDVKALRARRACRRFPEVVEVVERANAHQRTVPCAGAQVFEGDLSGKQFALGARL